MQVFNGTNLTETQVAALPLIGVTVSKWRERNIELRVHPTDPTRLISVGTTFDKRMCVIADEPRTSWTVALDYLARGKVYVSA